MRLVIDASRCIDDDADTAEAQDAHAVSVLETHAVSVADATAAARSSCSLKRPGGTTPGGPVHKPFRWLLATYSLQC